MFGCHPGEELISLDGFTTINPPNESLVHRLRYKPNWNNCM